VSARIVLRVALRFELEDGTPTHAPMVLATVGAIHTRLVVDTGADVQLLTREVAEAAGLTLGAADTGTDHAATEMPSWQVGDVAVDFSEAVDGGGLFVLRDVVAIPAPAAFTAMGIGGIVSPHRLDPAAFAVLDEIDDELVLLAAGVPEVRREMRRRHPDLEVLAFARREAGVPIIDAAIEPNAAMPFLINSGGRDTEVDAARLPGAAAGPVQRTGAGVSGSAVMGSRTGGQVARLGQRRIALASILLRAEMGEPPGMLGQDVLRGSVLAVGPDPATPCPVAASRAGPGRHAASQGRLTELDTALQFAVL